MEKKLSSGKRLVFAGAGHAHLFSLARLEHFLRGGAEVTVISPTPLWYSGMGPGMLGGCYEAGEGSVDVRALVERRGGRFLEGKIAAVRPKERSVLTEDGNEIPYDALSLNVGSEVSSPLLDGAPDWIFAVKPVSSYLELRRRMLALPPGAEPHIVVAGGGPSGCETAANVRELCRRHRRGGRITLSVGEAGLLPHFSPSARRLAESEFEKMGIEVTERRIVGRSGHTLCYSDGSTGTADFLAVATGVRPPRILAESGLAVDGEGAMIVDEYLQSVSSEGVFGGGDCIAFKPFPLRRAGVYAVRQGPVLFENLTACLSERPMRPFIPQREFLLILNLGRTGLLFRKPFVMKGRIPLLLKRWIDRRFVRSFQLKIPPKGPTHL